MKSIGYLSLSSRSRCRPSLTSVRSIPHSTRQARPRPRTSRRRLNVVSSWSYLDRYCSSTHSQPLAHSPPSSSTGYSTAAQPKGKDKAWSHASRSSPPAPTSEKSAEQREIDVLRHQLAQAQQAAAASPTKGRTLPQVNPSTFRFSRSARLSYVGLETWLTFLTESINTVAARRPQKGASLANPNKKARVYQELEFEDD